MVLIMSFLKATIEKIENEQVMLVFEDGKKVSVPSFLFEGTPEVGKSVRVRIAVMEAIDAGQTNLAKEIINEILTTNDV